VGTAEAVARLKRIATRATLPSMSGDVGDIRRDTGPRLLRFGLLVAFLLAAPAARADVEPSFQNVSLGGVITAGFGTSSAGYDLMGEVGGEYVGIRSFALRAWLVQWDALLAGRAGILANEHPFMALAGAHERGNVEAGSRVLPHEAWSPYWGFGLDTDLQVLTAPGVPIGNLDRYNNVDGVGGVTANGAIRVAVGASWLTSSHSVLLEVFFQEALRAPEVDAGGISFSEGGLSARWDIFQSFTLHVAAFAGRSPALHNTALNYTEQTVHAELDGDLRKTFRNGMWLGAELNLFQESHTLAYVAGHTYGAADPLFLAATLVFGIPLGRQE
jgi:hypothetical protein